MDPTKLKIGVVDMPEERKEKAVEAILKSLETFNSEEQMANFIKKEFDKGDPSWSIIVGKNFGSHIINQTKCYMFATWNNELSFLLWKS